MLTYRHTQWAFAICTLALFALCWLLGCSYWFLLLPLALFMIIVALGSYFIQWNFHLVAINHGDRKSRRIAITFDDGPHPTVTPQILSILKNKGIKATFFCIGRQLEQHPDIAKQIMTDGHILGNHSWEHGFWFDVQSAGAMQQELEHTNHALQQITGRKPKYFRPPYGVTNPNLAKAVKATGMTAIGWSLRTMDTVIKNPQKLVRRTKNRVKAGDIVLFHDTHLGTVSALGEFLDYCKNQGLEIVPLNELINLPAYE